MKLDKNGLKIAKVYRKVALFASMLLLMFVVSSVLASCGNAVLIDDKYEQDVLKGPNLRHLRKSFVKFTHNYHFSLCVTAKDIVTCEEYPEGTPFISSGVVLKVSEEGSHILTAGHSCEVDPEIELQLLLFNLSMPEGMETRLRTQFTVHNYQEIEHVGVEVVSINKKLDTCIVLVKDMKSGVSAKFSQTPPQWGDDIVNISAPGGLFSSEGLMVFDGRYSGEFKMQQDTRRPHIDPDSHSVYTFPSAKGASGSPIYNYYGEVVGMVHSVSYTMNQIVYSPKHAELLNEVNKHVYK